ncbi:MAG: hypothetical protein RL705_1980 [Bacteroidota bacterium]
MISFGPIKGVILSQRNCFRKKIHFKDFLRYTYRYLIKTLKIRLIFIHYLMIVLNDVKDLKKVNKTYVMDMLLKLKKVFLFQVKN